MSHNYTRLFYHFVWGTWDRTPLLVGEIREKAYAVIRSQCTAQEAKIFAVGGIENHVHLLVGLPATRDLPEFIKNVKGVSSRTLNQCYGRAAWSFKWQGRYGVTTVSPAHMKRIIGYIEKQKQHHADGDLWPLCEQIETD